jgi:hypothetical protein
MEKVFVFGTSDKPGVETLIIVPSPFFGRPETLPLNRVPELFEGNGLRPPKGKIAVLTDESAKDNPKVLNYIERGLLGRDSRTVFLNPELAAPESISATKVAQAGGIQDPVQTGGYSTTTFSFSKPNTTINFLYFNNFGLTSPFSLNGLQSSPSSQRFDQLVFDASPQSDHTIPQRLRHLYSLATKPAGLERISLVREASKFFGIDERMSISQIFQESSFNPHAVGPMTKYGTAKGMGQFIDSTFETYFKKVTKDHPELKLEHNPFNPRTSAYLHAAYMKDNLNRYSGNVQLALAAYNWGEGNLKKSLSRHGTNTAGTPNSLPNETRGYLQNILSIARDIDLSRLRQAPIIFSPIER